jgi:2-keto-4-pentenoate hydratase/2-oxohepta-3-ene-1,7-dioic acid hydratase in catechol pathway
MRIIRYQVPGEAPTYGWLQENVVGPIEGNPFQDFRRLEASLPLERVKLLPPTIPSKIICVGRNYSAHAEEHGAEVPQVPLIFLKPPSALLAPGDPIRLPPQSRHVEHEAELVVVIGRRGQLITPEAVNKHIFGYTTGNDVTARDLQRSDGQWTRSKGFDTFCPLGPWIETEFDSADAMLTCHVNGQLRQMASTRDMVFSIRRIVSFASAIMTLEAGDIIMTGTPAGVSPLSPGDVVEVTIEGIGKLSNPVAGP